MQKREDSCDLYFWEVADVGEWNYADYLVSQGIPIPTGWGVGQVTEVTVEEEDVEQKVKDAVPLIMARQQPNMHQVATRTVACGSHHTPAGTRTIAGCS